MPMNDKLALKLAKIFELTPDPAVVGCCHDYQASRA